MRVDGIDITRGLLALSVAIYHYTQFLNITCFKKFHAIMTSGVTSVDGFFVISGFALFYSYHSTDFTQIKHLKDYFWRRFARLAPLFYLCMLLNVISEQMVLGVILLLCFFGIMEKKAKISMIKYFCLLILSVLFVRLGTTLTTSYDKLIILNNLSFLFGFINPNLTHVRGGWSIGVECVFYLSLPFIVCLIKNNVQKLLVIGFLTISLAVNYQLLNNTNLYTYDSAKHAQSLIDNWPLYTNPLNHFYFFMAGGLLFALYTRHKNWFITRQRRLLICLLILLIIYCLLDNLTDNASYGYGRFFYSILMLLIIGLTPFISIKSSWLKQKFVMLGDISYSVYLMQFPVYSCVIYLANKYTALNSIEVFFVSLICLLFVSYFVYTLYEMPAKKWLININNSPAILEKQASVTVS